MFGKVLSRTQRLLADSQLGLASAVKLRNQCDVIIGLAHGKTIIDPGQNGEAAILNVLGSRVHYFIDVGANRGAWTDLALKYAHISAGLLLDPSQSASDILRRRFAELPHIKVITAAAGDCPGQISFFEEEHAGETSSVIAGASKAAHSAHVSVTTLDLEVERLGWPTVDYLKIDAEGYDFRVLLGATQLLTDKKVLFGQFEYDSTWRLSGSTLTFATRWLLEKGYGCLLMKGDGLHPPNLERYQEYFHYSNYLFFRQDFQPELTGMLRGEI